MDTAITRAEHEEFCRRMEDEHHRLNKRMELLENNVKQIGDLNVSVANLASSMNRMLGCYRYHSRFYIYTAWIVRGGVTEWIYQNLENT